MAAKKKKLRNSPSGVRRPYLGPGAIVQSCTGQTIGDFVVPGSGEDPPHTGAGVIPLVRNVMIAPPTEGSILELKCQFDVITTIPWAASHADSKNAYLYLDLSLDGGTEWFGVSNSNAARHYPANDDGEGANRMRWLFARSVHVIAGESYAAAPDVRARARIVWGNSEASGLTVLGGQGGYVELQECVPYIFP